MKLISTLFLLTFFSVSSAIACSCGGPRTFCGFADMDFEDRSSIAVKATKISTVAHGMDLSVSLIFAGDEDNDIIRVWGDVGHLCRKYASSFQVGQEYLLILNRITETFPNTAGDWANLEKIGDYSISFCGKTFWSCAEEAAGGTTGAEIEACFGQPLELCGSTPASTTDPDFCNIEKTELYPNPASNYCLINLPEAPNLTKGSGRIFDSCGKEVIRFDRIDEFYRAGQLTFDLSRLQSGLYFLDLEFPGFCKSNLTRRLVVRK